MVDNNIENWFYEGSIGTKTFRMSYRTANLYHYQTDPTLPKSAISGLFTELKIIV